MQKLLILTFLLFATSFLRAVDLPKLNLEIGKKYTMETIFLEDTSKTNQRREYDKKIYELVPTGFNRNEGIYDIRLTICYFMHVRQEMNKQGVWSEKEVYETGYPSTFSRPVVFMNRHLVTVKIRLSNEGQISSFDFSQYAKLKSPNGIEPNLGEWDQKELEEDIRLLFFNKKEVKTTWSHDYGFRSNYRIIRTNVSTIEAEADYIETRVDDDKYASTKDHFKRKILIDKSTGLILEEKLTYIWNSFGKRNTTRYQKWVSVFSERFEANQKTGESKYEKTVISNPNTAIRITIRDSTEYPKFIDLSYFDESSNSIKSFQLEKDRNGDFNIQLHLQQFQTISLHFNPETINFANSFNLFLSPGDNLSLEIRKSSDPEPLVFNGIGAEENHLIQLIRNLNTNKQKFEGGKSVQPSLINDSAFQILNWHRFNINPEIYLELGNTLIYNPYLTGLQINPDSLNNLKVPVCNTLAARNSSYHQFLKRYVYLFMERIRQSSSNLNPSIDHYERDYSFGQLLFPEPILSEYLAQTVEEALLFGKWSNAELLYHRHLLASPKSPRVLKTEQLYKLYARFAPGSFFPIDTITDLNGNMINLHKQKNKLVIITTHWIVPAINLVSETESWKYKKRDYVSLRDNIINIRFVVGTRDQRSKLKAALGNNSEGKIVFINSEDIFWTPNFLSPLLIRKNFVLGRDGIILFNSEVDSALLQNAIEELKTPHFLKGASNFILKIIALSLLGILILAGLAFIVYRQVSRRQLKRAELNRRMREL